MIRHLRKARSVRGLRFGRGFGHIFGLLFLARHPILIVVVVVVVFAIYLYRRRR